MTLHPETDIIASRKDGDAYVYTVRKQGRTREVRVPAAAFKGIPAGPLGVPQRRAVLARAVGGKA